VKEDVVRHDDCSDNTKGSRQRSCRNGWHKGSVHKIPDIWFGREQICKEASSHYSNEKSEKCLKLPDSEIMDKQKQKGIQYRDQGPGPQRQSKQYLQCGSRPHYFLNISSNDCQLSHYPKDVSSSFSKLLSAKFCQISLSYNPESRGHRLIKQS